MIASYPSERRDGSRLMVCHRRKGSIEHRLFHHIADYLREGDLLLLNDTKVIPARLIGRKATGGAVELLLVRRVGGGKERQQWSAMVKPSRGVRGGTIIRFERGLTAEVVRHGDNGWWEINLTADRGVDTLINEVGVMPLPPYIKRPSTEGDRERYQTVFAKKEGAIAAPTAGLHFTDEILNRLGETGVETFFITLHTGPGTFLPVRTELVEEHTMLPEYYQIDETAFAAVMRAKKRGGRVIAVGSTATRAVEAAVRDGFGNPILSGFTDLFIYPGYTFRIVDGLVTNFHLPRSTLLMLVAAFAGRETTLRLYREAVREKYRFYSYGDAMLLL
ncbi:MAG: tRNA preQ1(34) S-adenosylmethionine ribosyltransferase-isomerase QueA [Thermodesulfobacteriota bacterium]